MRDVTLVILNSLRIKCHIRRPLTCCAEAVAHALSRVPGHGAVGCEAAVKSHR